METGFWHARWTSNQIGFHRDSVNPQLERWWPACDVPAGSRVLVPLCGKSLDMCWLAERGYSVTGIELSPIAVEAFFEENDRVPEVTEVAGLQRFASGAIEIFCGDFFALDHRHVGDIAAVYDRAALIALPADMRARYVAHLATLVAPAGRGMLVTLAYDDTQMQGPPFSVPPDEVTALLGDTWQIEQLAHDDVLHEFPHLQDAGLQQLDEYVFRLERLQTT